MFLPAHLVVQYDSHEVKSKVPNDDTKNGANESQQQKNSGMPNTSVGSNMNTALKEFKKAGIRPGEVSVACQMIALQQYEDEQKQKLAKPKKNKEKIEQQKRIQEAKDELKMDDWSCLDTSLLDIEKQRKILEEATHNKKMQEEKRLREENAQKIRLQQEEVKRIQEAAYIQEKYAEQPREEAAREKRLQEESMLQEATQWQKEDAATQKRVYEEAAQQQGYNPTKPDLQPSNDNPHNLKLGTMVQFGNPPCYGVIKWIGSLPDTNCVMAGVELVSCT